MTPIDSVGPTADGQLTPVDRAPPSEPIGRSAAPRNDDIPAGAAHAIQDLNAAVAHAKHAILSGMLSGDIGAAAAIGDLAVAAAVIDRLIATLPPNLGVQVDLHA